MKGFADLDLRLLRVFVIVAKSGGFTAAEAVLNVSQSTISNHMAALEQRLGYRLCQRGRVGFKLTEKGRSVFEAAERLFTAIDSYRAETDTLRGQLAGELRLGVVDNTVTDRRSPLVEAFERFNKRNHSVTFNITMDSPQQLELAILDGRLHAAIGSFPKLITGLNYQPLYEERHAFYCGAGHPLFPVPEDRVTLDDLRMHRVISRGYWNLEDVVRLGYGRADAYVDEMESILTLILSGAYLGFLPEHLADSWVRKGQLRSLLPSHLNHAAMFYVVTPKGNGSSPLAEAFVTDLLAANEDVNGQKTTVRHLRVHAKA